MGREMGRGGPQLEAGTEGAAVQLPAAPWGNSHVDHPGGPESGQPGEGEAWGAPGASRRPSPRREARRNPGMSLWLHLVAVSPFPNRPGLSGNKERGEPRGKQVKGGPKPGKCTPRLTIVTHRRTHPMCPQAPVGLLVLGGRVEIGRQEDLAWRNWGGRLV